MVVYTLSRYVVILDNNQLSGKIPSELGLLTRLEWLHLGEYYVYNHIRSLVSFISFLVSILDGNQLTGKIPDELLEIEHFYYTRTYSFVLGGMLCHSYCLEI